MASLTDGAKGGRHGDAHAILFGQFEAAYQTISLGAGAEFFLFEHECEKTASGGDIGRIFARAKPSVISRIGAFFRRIVKVGVGVRPGPSLGKGALIADYQYGYPY